MKRLWIGALAAALFIFGWSAVSPETALGTEAEPPGLQQGEQAPEKPPPPSPKQVIDLGLSWLVSVQGEDGGWGQDGGATSHVRVGESLESNGNDVANTAVAVLALVRSGYEPGHGKYGETLDRGIDFILGQVEQSPIEGLAVTSVRDTQIQRKLGPYIDTFLSSMLLSELDGQMRDKESNDRVRLALEKCIHKIEQNQLEDGSWNLSGGWAPILGTSLASRSLFAAEQKGVVVSGNVLAKVDDYTKNAAARSQPGGEALRSAPATGLTGGVLAEVVTDAGVGLYRDAQILEQLSRTEEDRERNADEISVIQAKLSDDRFVDGFGSIGGEEFFSYLNVGDSLKRDGGDAWEAWNDKIQTKIVHLQNEDGSWAGHHCITGRVAVTSAAVLNLLAGAS